MILSKTIAIEVDIEAFAAQLISSDDQAEFFNCLAIKFRGFADGDGDGRQMLYIKDDLTETAKQFIAKLSEYVNSD